MRAFVYGGYDFGELCRAKVVEERPLAVKPVVAGVLKDIGEVIPNTSLHFNGKVVDIFFSKIVKPAM